MPIAWRAGARFAHGIALALALGLGLAACAPPACSDAADREISHEVSLLVVDDGPVGEAAARRLARRGRSAIAVLETGLYGANPAARRRIVRVLRDIGDPEAAPILRHLSRRDPDPDVRAAASTALADLATPVVGTRTSPIHKR